MSMCLVKTLNMTKKMTLKEKNTLDTCITWIDVLKENVLSSATGKKPKH